MTYADMTDAELKATLAEYEAEAAKLAKNRQRKNDYSDRIANVRGALLGRGVLKNHGR